MTAPIITPELLATLAQFLQAQGSAPAPATVPVVPVAKKIDVICKKNDKHGVSMEDVSIAKYPTAEEFSKVGQIGRMFAKAAIAGKAVPEGYIRINKNGAVSVLVDVDDTTKSKMRLILKTDPVTRLKAWRAYTEAAKQVRGITIGGLDLAIKSFMAEPGAAPLTFKAKVENLLKEPISDADKIRKISEMLEDGRSKTAEVAPEPVAEETPAPKKRKAAAK